MKYQDNAFKGISTAFLTAENVFKDKESVKAFLRYLQKYFTDMDKDEKDIFENYLLKNVFLSEYLKTEDENSYGKFLTEKDAANLAGFFNYHSRPVNRERKDYSVFIMENVLKKEYRRDFFKNVSLLLDFFEKIADDEEFIREYFSSAKEEYYDDEYYFQKNTLFQVYDVFFAHAVTSAMAQRANGIFSKEEYQKTIDSLFVGFLRFLKKIKVPLELSDSFKLLFSEEGIFFYLVRNKEKLDDEYKKIIQALKDFPESDYTPESLFYCKSFFGGSFEILKKYAGGESLAEKEYSVLKGLLKKTLYDNEFVKDIELLFKIFERASKEKILTEIVFDEELGKEDYSGFFHESPFASSVYYALLRRNFKFEIINSYRNNDGVSIFGEKHRQYIEAMLNDEKLVKSFVAVNEYVMKREDFFENGYNKLENGSIEKYLVDLTEYIRRLSESVLPKKEILEYTERILNYKIKEEDKEKILRNPEGFFFLLYSVSGVFTESFDRRTNSFSSLSRIAANFGKINKELKGNFLNYSILKNLIYNFATSLSSTHEKIPAKNLFRLYKNFGLISFIPVDKNLKESLAGYYPLGEAFYYCSLKRLHFSISLPDMFDRDIKFTSKEGTEDTSLSEILSKVYYKDFLKFYSEGFLHYDYKKLSRFLCLSPKKSVYEKFSPFELFIISGGYDFEVKSADKFDKLKNEDFNIIISSYPEINNEYIKIGTFEKNRKDERFSILSVKFIAPKEEFRDKYYIHGGQFLFKGFPCKVWNDVKEEFAKKEKNFFYGNLFELFIKYGNDSLKNELLKESVDFVKKHKDSLTKAGLSQKEVLKTAALGKTEEIPFIGPAKNYFKEGMGIEEYVQKSLKDNAISIFTNFKEALKVVKEHHKSLEKNNIIKGKENGIER